MKKSSKKTIKYYDENALDWAGYHNELGVTSRRMEDIKKFRELLPHGKMIEIGSGTGSDAGVFIESGYEYVGIDASAGLLEIAKKRNPKGNFKHLAVQDLAKAFTENEFNGFWTSATLLHVPKGELDNVLKSIHTIVKDDGIGYISVKQGEGEGEDDLGRFFAYYTQSEFVRILEENGFEIVEKEIKPTEGETVWLKFFVRVKK